MPIDLAVLPLELQDDDNFRVFFDGVMEEVHLAAPIIFSQLQRAIEQLTKHRGESEGNARKLCQPFHWDEQTVTKTWKSAREKLCRELPPNGYPE